VAFRRDVQEHLEALDRKLDALGVELARLRNNSNAAHDLPSEPAREEREPPRPAPEPPRPEPAAEPWRPPHPAPRGPDWPGNAEEEAERILSRARADAARIVSDAATRAAEVSRRVDDLERAVRQLAEVREGLVGERPGAEPPFAPPRGVVLRGEVRLDAGPFPDIATLGEVERALQSLPAASEARVREFAGDRAVIELALDRDVELEAELRDALSFPVSVRRTGMGSITLEIADR
jgi:hypothetical protein